jgi:NAD(P)-dependent dehydrogenase (short-subunit alcohol dehydrogenase family)
MKLRDRVSIVTGAAMGIGRAIALRLAREGADVIVADINIEQANKVVDEIGALKGKAIAVKADVTDTAAVKAMVKSTLDEFGKIDILVNNAGQSARELRTLFCDSKEEVWDFMINLNLKGTLNCCRAVIHHMMQRQSGKIVNIASRCGVFGCVGQADYSAAKAGVIRFSDVLAKEVASYGINVNSICSAPIDTLDTASFSEEEIEILKKRTGWGNLGKPEDMANMVAFLVSDEAKFISGQSFMVSGPFP